MTMPRAVTSGELATQRKDGGVNKLYLAFLPRRSVYTAVLDDLPASNDSVASITYVSGSGTLADVRIGMSLLIGTSAGDDDLGRVYVRKAPTADTFYIGVTSAIEWEAAAYLTIIEDYRLTAKNAAVVSEELFMDYDVDYVDQNTDFNPVPVMGPHRVAKLTGATVAVTLGADTTNGQASWVFDSTISTYLWDIPDALSVDNTAAVNPVATFDAVGWYACYLTVTAANGKSKTGVRWVYVYDDDNKPPAVWSMTSWREDYSAGGVSCNASVVDNADVADVQEGALCILFSEDVYGAGTAAEAGSIGQVTGCENIRMIGRIGDEGFQYNSNSGSITFEIQNSAYWLSKIYNTPSGVVIATNTPAEWTSIAGLTVDRAVWHYLEWRSTATTVMDFISSGDTRNIPEGGGFSGDIFSNIENITNSALLGNIHVDAFDRLFVEIDPQVLPEDERAAGIPTVMTLTKTDYKDDVTVDRQLVSDVSSVNISGMKIDAYGGSLYTYWSISPGITGGEFGRQEIHDRLAVTSQAECNELAGLIYGWRLNESREVEITLRGNNNMISCFPRQYVVFEVEAGDTPRNKALSGNWVVRRRTITFDNEAGTFEITLLLEAETFEQNAVAYVPPSGDDISVPPLPPIPDVEIPIDIYPTDLNSLPATVLIWCDPQGFLFTNNFNADEGEDVVWGFCNSGIPSGITNGCRDFFIAPNGSCWALFYSNDFETPRICDRICYAPAVGAEWVEVISPEWMDTEFPSSGQIQSFAYNPNAPEDIAFMGRTNGSLAKIVTGDRNGFTVGATSSATGIANVAGDMSWGNGK